MSPAEFDRFATSYDQDLAKSLAVTGEDRGFYAREESIGRHNASRGIEVKCDESWITVAATGGNAPLLAAKFKAEHVLGVDVSIASIALARQVNHGAGVSFLCSDEWTPDGTMDLAFTNGVFHHIPPGERRECLVAIRRALCPGGLFAFWENNPWNPGTRYVMSQCDFDENAVTISPREAHKILSEAGFKLLRTDSLFYFPRQLRWLRLAERWFRGFPFGGQYQVFCQNPPE